MTQGAKGRGDVAPPASSFRLSPESGRAGPINKSHLFWENEGEALRTFFDMIECAGTQSEWNSALADMMSLALSDDPKLSLGVSHDRRIWRLERERLVERVREGFKGTRGRPQSRRKAMSDGFLIQRAYISKQIKTFTDARHLLHAALKIPIEQARKRVERAEKELGFRLPRSLRQFPKPRK